MLGDVILPALGIPLGYTRWGVFVPLSGFWVTLFSAILVLLWVANRLSLSLPAVALDQRISLWRSWKMTAPLRFQILVFSGLYVGVGAVFVFGIEAIAAQFGTDTPMRVVAAIVSSLGTWVTTMLGISILTTLYGHLIEQRPLTA